MQVVKPWVELLTLTNLENERSYAQSDKTVQSYTNSWGPLNKPAYSA